MPFTRRNIALLVQDPVRYEEVVRGLHGHPLEPTVVVMMEAIFQMMSDVRSNFIQCHLCFSSYISDLMIDVGNSALSVAADHLLSACCDLACEELQRLYPATPIPLLSLSFLSDADQAPPSEGAFNRYGRGPGSMTT